MQTRGPWKVAIVFGHLRLMAKNHDTLIRSAKRGETEAAEAGDRTFANLAGGLAEHTTELTCCSDEFDAWLRAEGQWQRNPGTTADLMAASLVRTVCARIIS